MFHRSCFSSAGEEILRLQNVPAIWGFLIQRWPQGSSHVLKLDLNCSVWQAVDFCMRGTQCSPCMCVCVWKHTGMIIGLGGCPLSLLVTVFPTHKNMHQSESRTDDMEQTEKSKTWKQMRVKVMKKMLKKRKRDVKSEAFEMLLSSIFSSVLKIHLNLFGRAKGKNSQKSLLLLLFWTHSSAAAWLHFHQKKIILTRQRARDRETQNFSVSPSKCGSFWWSDTFCSRQAALTQMWRLGNNTFLT